MNGPNLLKKKISVVPDVQLLFPKMLFLAMLWYLLPIPFLFRLNHAILVVCIKADIGKVNYSMEL